MSHSVRFNSPFRAMSYAARYNPKGVRLILAEVRKAAKEGQPWNFATLQFAMCFAAIQGYPVVCFFDALVAKGLMPDAPVQPCP